MTPTQSQNEQRLPFVKNDILYVYDLIDISNNESTIQNDNLSEINVDTSSSTNSEGCFHQDTLQGHHDSIIDFLSFSK